MYRKESFTELEPSLSRLLDSLCLELAYTRSDCNSFSLLEIMGWRQTGEITDQEEFTQLYRQWLVSKGVFDMTKTKQIDTVSKMELIKVNSSIDLRSEREVMEVLRVLRKQYNTIFLSLNREKSSLIEAIDSLFSMLDIEECFHLRKPQLLLLFQSLILSKVYVLKPATIDNFWRVYSAFEKQVNIVENKLSIRAFKNYFIKNISLEEVEVIGRNLDLLKYSMGFYHDGIKAWKKNLKGCAPKHQLVQRRVFMENQHLFLVESQDSQNSLTELSIGYGASFLAVNNIDTKTLQEFGKVMQGIVRRHIADVLKSMDKQESQASSLHTQTSKTKTIRMGTSISAKKSIVKRESMRTPTKSQAFFTPRKETTSTRNKKAVSPLSKTRQSIKTFSPTNPNAILQSLSIFKNQRIESFQSVMKRLKKR